MVAKRSRVDLRGCGLALNVHPSPSATSCITGRKLDSFSEKKAEKCIAPKDLPALWNSEVLVVPSPSGVIGD